MLIFCVYLLEIITRQLQRLRQALLPESPVVPSGAGGIDIVECCLLQYAVQCIIHRIGCKVFRTTFHDESGKVGQFRLRSFRYKRRNGRSVRPCNGECRAHRKTTTEHFRAFERMESTTVTSHRQSGNGSSAFGCLYSVSRFYCRNKLIHKIVFVIHILRITVAIKRAVCFGRDDNHLFAYPISDSIVGNGFQVAVGFPRSVILPKSMQEIENGVFFVRVSLITRRQVNGIVLLPA